MQFNGVNFDRWLKTNPTLSLVPTIIDYWQDLDGRDGAQFVRTRLDKLVISVFARLQLSSFATYEEIAKTRREIRAALVTNEPKKLILDEPDKYYMAKLTNAAALSNLWANGSCELEFTAYDPIAYGATKTVKVGENTTISVKGTWKTRPVFDLRGTAEAPVKVENLTTHEYVLMEANASEGSHIVIDMAEETTRQNTNLSTIDITSDYFALLPGENDIQITNATGTCTYTERWL